MYRPPHFRNDDDAAAFRLIADYGFATLVSVVDGRPMISQLPMIGDAERRLLRGHVARGNPHGGNLGGARATAIFTGVDGYISPNWYQDRTRVPTWDFESVEVEGEARLLTTDEEIDAMLIEFSAHHERRRHDLAQDSEWKIEKLPPEKQVRLRRGIIAFEISIERIEMKSKLSQNSPAEDRAGVLAALAAGNEAQRALGEAIRKAAP